MRTISSLVRLLVDESHQAKALAKYEVRQLYVRSKRTQAARRARIEQLFNAIAAEQALASSGRTSRDN
jgi:hypothetical protein